MKYVLTITTTLFLCITSLFSQNPKLLSGPWQGATTPQSTRIWMMGSHWGEVRINGDVIPLIRVNDTMSVAQAQLDGLMPNSSITTKIVGVNGGEITQETKLRLPDTQMEDFSFLIGSCSFPYKPKNKRWHIFEKMATVPSDFMMWMGDNIYLILGDWKSRARICQRYVKYRTNPHLNRFLSAQPNFAAWDDHDFGPNNSGSGFKLKDTTLQAFKDFWVNPQYGTDELPGTFYSFRWHDAEFFVLDGRYYKSDMAMYGQGQLDWLKKKIKKSTASVKFIVGGCQFLVDAKGGEDWGDYPQEKNGFLQFLNDENIRGIVFLSGDRHLAELTILDGWGGPTLVEMTSSPMTSFVNPTFNNKNPLRVKGTLAKKRNFGKISLKGEGGERMLILELLDKKARSIWKHEFRLSGLK